MSLAAPTASAQFRIATDRASEVIHIAADSAQSWRDDQSEIYVLEGNSRVRQGTSDIAARQAVLWIELGRYGERTGKVVGYFEGNLQVQLAGFEKPRRFPGDTWLTTFDSSLPPELHIGRVEAATAPPPIYHRAHDRRTPSPASGIVRTQFTEEVPVPGAADAPPPGTRRLRVFARYGVPPSLSYFPNEQAGEWIALITGGVNLVVDGVGPYGTLDISTDRMVIWTSGQEQPNLTVPTFQSENTPLEFYLEGNIVFRQGDRRIEAQRMYYNVNQQTGVVLEADMLTPVPQYQGLLRLRAAAVQQLGPDQFLAQDAFLTSSRLGRPTYRLASGEIYYSDQQRPVVDPFTGQPQVDPVTGEQVIDHDRLATSTNNLLYLDEVPVFYWPWLATDLEDPRYFIKRVRFGIDEVFGTQVYTDFDMYQLLGIRNPPPGTEWEVSLDYLSKRGLAAGTNFKYNVPEFFSLQGPTTGFLDIWGINDDGADTLGSDRVLLPPDPDVDIRYRLLAQHRQILPNNYQLTGEFGLVSDRNFLEQFYELEWDRLKDQSTGLELKQIVDNTSWSISADVRLNDFFMQTEWLPRLDHFWLGQSFLGDRLTWYEHSSAGYARLRTAEPPSNPVELAKFGLLPGEAEVEGERFVTRQEVDFPFEAGPFKLVPFALGELAHWGEDLSGDDLQRAYGQIGIRASIPFWTANNEIEDPLFNVHGIAHKVVLDAELSFADATADLSELPMYDQIDDDAIEQFRRRLAFNTFGVPHLSIPAHFDPRFYALRSGLGGWVTSPSAEIADDLAALRLGARQRWQTKRGLPGQRRIIDWIVLDTEIVYFPSDDRDNFGESLGLAQYDFRWHVGDRTTLVSDGMFDFFDQGQEIFSVGAFVERPPRGGLYLGFQSLNGPAIPGTFTPFKSQVVSASYSYRMSPKWISSIGTSFDIAGNGNIGQNINITRVGESFLLSLGFNVDASKGNVGFQFALEPRFLPTTRLGRVAGAQVPIAGLMGLE